VRDTVDTNLDYVADSIKIYKGTGGPELALSDVEVWNGSAWVAPGDKAAVWAALQGTDGIRFKDNTSAGALGRGQTDTGVAIADGTNIIYISYDATVRSSITPDGSSTSEATLVNFANGEG